MFVYYIYIGTCTRILGNSATHCKLQNNSIVHTTYPVSYYVQETSFINMELYQSNHVSATSNEIDKNINQFDDGWEEVPSKQFRRKKRTPISPLIKIDQYIIILCGIPGSGKSEFAEKLCRLNPLKFARVSQDVLGSRKKCENACRQSLRDGRIPIIDRCNFDSSQRIHFLSIAAEHKVAVDCIVFQYSRQVRKSIGCSKIQRND